tara:strand:+ start:442 stop:1923 length:1482 start_codon:yes stop_codon:yes gene_type:complete
LIYAALVPVNPAGDEAYYWDWGRQLDYGYFSKPPFIAWLYAFVDWIGGGSLFAIRATAAIIGTASILVLYQLASSLFDQKIGWLTVVVGLAAPAYSVLSFFLTIDAPLVLCWSIALWMFWRYLSGKGKTATLVVLFLALGVGHLSKQMMMIFPVFAILLLLLNRETHPFLKRPGLWLSLFGSYLALAPPLIWNSQNEWITFKHTGHHFQSGAEEANVMLQRLEDFGSFLGSQLGAISPMIGLTLFCVCLFGLKSIRSTSLPVRFLLVFGALPLAGMLLMALRQELQPNWPAVFYVSCMTLTAGFYGGAVNFGFPPEKWRRWLKAGVIFGIALNCYFYFGSALFVAIGMPGHKADPNRRLMGHDKVAAGFESIRSSQPDAEDLFIVTYGHRYTTSQMAFGLPDQPRVYRWEMYDTITSQYELWTNPSQDGYDGKDGIILVPELDTFPAELEPAFTAVKKIGEFDVIFGYDREVHYSVFRGVELIEWPAGLPLPK